MTKQSAYVGGEAARDGSPLDGLGGRLDRWGPKPAPSEEAKDTAAAEQDADAEIDAELDAEDAARVANMRRLGLADPETAEKAPAATLASVEKELADVSAVEATFRLVETLKGDPPVDRKIRHRVEYFNTCLRPLLVGFDYLIFLNAGSTFVVDEFDAGTRILFAWRIEDTYCQGRQCVLEKLRALGKKAQ